MIGACYSIQLWEQYYLSIMPTIGFIYFLIGLPNLCQYNIFDKFVKTHSEPLNENSWV